MMKGEEEERVEGEREGMGEGEERKKGVGGGMASQNGMERAPNPPWDSGCVRCSLSAFQ